MEAAQSRHGQDGVRETAPARDPAGLKAGVRGSRGAQADRLGPKPDRGPSISRPLRRREAPPGIHRGPRHSQGRRRQRLGVPREAVTPEQRKLAKALVFGLLYGQGLKGFADKAREVFKKDYSEREVEKRFWQPFFDAYPGVARWREDAINRFKSGRKDTYTALGRRRLHLEKDTQALNSPIQGGAADVMKSIAVAVYKRRPEVPGLEIVGLVHDEILATVPEERTQAAHDLVAETMEEVGAEIVNIGVPEGKRVPVKAGTKICTSWDEKE